MSQAEVPVPAAYMPVSERPTSSQSNSTPSRANTAASPQANTATPQPVVSNGAVIAPKPLQSLNRTTAPQFPAVPASSAGTIPVETYDNWRVGLCDVDDMETCVAAWCVPCCLSGRINQRLENFPREDPGQYDECNSTCCISFMLYSFDLGCVSVYMDRNMIRRTFNIKGNPCLDCVTAFFCTPCALSQVNFELKRRGEEARTISQQYRSGRPQMAYMPPQTQPMVQQSQMMPANAACLQVPARSQPQSRIQQYRPEQPQMQPMAQYAPQLPAVQSSSPAQH